MQDNEGYVHGAPVFLLLRPIPFRCLALASLAFAVLEGHGATRFDLAGPAGSGLFGSSVTVLPNGNFVVTDPGYDVPGGASNVGAVYLYSPTGQQISKLTGGSSDDAVGSGGVTIVGNGNFVVRSPDWAYGIGAHDAGAVTWGSGVSGVSGVVSEANSLVGNKANDFVGQSGTTLGSTLVLSNGNYAVCSPSWNNGTVPRAGAVTWGDGNSGVKGIVSAANSIIGSTMNDEIGRYPAIPLKNGSYVVRSPQWDNGAAEDAGAVTWCQGNGPTAGIVGPAISLVGSKTDDEVGFVDDIRGSITALANGNYVVWSPFWDNGAVLNAGAVTWGSGTGGTVGVLSSANSVVGTSTEDLRDWVWVTELSNGHYVVSMSNWANGALVDAGAVMWCDGTTGRSGTISSANALVGNFANSLLGYVGTRSGITPLTNGNYVISSPYWNNGVTLNMGAATWCNGATGRTGTISAANSLVGVEASTNIGEKVTALTNGHYVVCSPYARVNGLGQAGAATWCDGTTGRSGNITANNSLYGAQAGDQVGLDAAVALPSGNYVVVSFFARNAAIATAGAVTWCNGATGRVGAISLANSLMGGHVDARVGSGGVTVLANGHYVVRSGIWDNGAVNGVGAITWCNGGTGKVGTVALSNSLIGSSPSDQIGSGGILALPNGNYVVHSNLWDNTAAADAGAVTWCDGSVTTSGVVSAANSLVGGSASDQIGNDGLVLLANGDYAVRSYLWDNAGVSNAGAVTRGSATAGVKGLISAANSLVGVTASDRIGEGPALMGSDGAYLFSSPKWNHGNLSDAGAVMLMPPGASLAGELSVAAGVPGTVATRGSSLAFAYDPVRARAMVGRPHANTVSLFSHGQVFNAADQLALWAAGQGIAAESAGADAEPFGDGVPNLLKYAFNLDGSKPDCRVMAAGGNAGLPLFSLTGETGAQVLRLEYLRRIDSGLIYRPLVSITPRDGELMGGSETVTPVDASWERVVRELPVDPLLQPSLFGWVEVSLP